MKKIKILPNGPYEVTGFTNLIEETIKPKNHVLAAVKTKDIEVTDAFHLCRCGESKNKPFCDGSHRNVNFDGTETADTRAYLERATLQEGAGVSLLDDNRCAFARFCHRERGEVWTLTDESADAENKREAIEGASACPTGRLTAVLNNTLLENKYEPSISIVQDPLKRVSAGIFIRGDFVLESASGKFYEKRNRLALCRCGKSENKPFCDAVHVTTNFNDKN
ncbi:MAG: CDGSH iron-sulfur domain-containing protein [Campylobacteraceae bacterium]